MSHFLALHFSLARRLIGPGQTDVLSFLGVLQIEPDWSSGGPGPSPGFFQRSEGAPSATLLAIGLLFSFAGI